tara:strand:+ start:194 stop:541 length:348 start_codon:yes stop_codon:yes gene_type:complete
MKYHSSEAKARTHDPKTSWEAAEKVDTNRLEKIVLKAIQAHGEGGATHDQIFQYLSMRFKDAFREGSITPRYATLERKGFIKRDGTTRKGRAGRSQLVMFYVDTGYRQTISEKKS